MDERLSNCNVKIGRGLELTSHVFIRYNMLNNVDGGRHLCKGRKLMVLYDKQLRKTCLGILLGAVCLMTSLLFLFIDAKADTIIRTGIVEISSGNLNFRTGPGTEYDVIGWLKNGDSGVIHEDKKATNGTVWYKMTVGNKTGWASSTYVRVVETVVKEDKDFDTYLAEQGFPESYKAQLRALHTMYPNWVFQAQHTNLNWSDAVKGESALGTNLVHSGAESSWKSTQNGAYDWKTGEWYEFDSGGWVAASTEIIQHFMDPRNFLDSTNIFQFIKQSYNASALTAEQLSQKKTDLTNMVKGTYLAGTGKNTSKSYVDIIMSAAAQSGVCPFTLASMMIQEQGTDGSGRSISGTVEGYKGYYNYLNIAAYKDSNFDSAVERGLWYASGQGSGKTSYNRPWTNAEVSITGGAIYYGEGFVKVGQDTLYLKKFNVQGSNLYGHQYMTNVQGAASEGIHMAKAYDANARKSALVFKIPVYKNMPATPCLKPSGDGNPNYMLKSLEVEGYSITPTFNMYETTYELIVENNIEKVNVKAVALATTTTITGTGAKTLKVGDNVVKVVAKAQSGAERTYQINIVRKAAQSSDPVTPPVTVPTPTVSSSSYKIDKTNNMITGIVLNNSTKSVSVTVFKSKLTVTDGSVRIMGGDGKEKSSDENIGTGDKVEVLDKDNNKKITYNIVIYGDTDGDGQIATMDYVQIRKYIVDGFNLSGYKGKAADTDRSGIIDLMDYVSIRKEILGEYTIPQ